MKISIKEIKEIFEKLLNQEIKREFASNWAFLRQQAEDKGELVYEPPSDEKKIWKALTYFQGIDLKDKPDVYLHDLKYISEFKNKNDI